MICVICPGLKPGRLRYPWKSSSSSSSIGVGVGIGGEGARRGRDISRVIVNGGGISVDNRLLSFVLVLSVFVVLLAVPSEVELRAVVEAVLRLVADVGLLGRIYLASSHLYER